MAVTNNFASSALNLNGQVNLIQPTAIVWGPDGRLYVTEVDGDVKVLSVSFGDPNPSDTDNTAQFYVTDAVTIALVKAIPNHNDDGTASASTNRQVTGIDVTQQYDAAGNKLYLDTEGNLTTVDTGDPAVTMYVTSSDSRIGGAGGPDPNLDTNSGVITKLVQTGTDTWTAIDIVRGLPRSEENHATNGLEVVQEFDVNGLLISERIIVASGGNANAGAPSNNFAAQPETVLSAAILEIDLTALNSMPVLIDGSRQYIYNIPTLNDPSRVDDVNLNDINDPFGGNDGFNNLDGVQLALDGLIKIYSPGYRNAYDVEVTEDGRIWTYDNGANDSWGSIPIGEAGDNGGATDFAQTPGYIATNLNNGDGNNNDTINVDDWNPQNRDQFHEITRSDDLDGRTLSVGGTGAVTTFLGIDGNTYVYGGHPNPTRAEGTLAGLLFSPGATDENAFLLVSDQDTYGNGSSDFTQIVTWLTAVENNNASFPTTGIYGADPGELTSRVLAVTPGILYDIYVFADGSGEAVVAGGPPPVGGTLLGHAGLPADFADIVANPNPVEGDYKEGGYTDGALDSGFGSINGLAEYTSTILDTGTIKMSGALLATQLGGGNVIVMGRNADGTMPSTTSGGAALAADRTVIAAAGGPLGIATIGDNIAELGLHQAFQGSIWTAVYQQNGPVIEIFQPNNGAVPLAGQVLADPNDQDLDGVDKFNDPFEFDADNGLVLTASQEIVLDFDKTFIDPLFQTTLNDVGLLGAAIDGVTPNQDAQTAAENFPIEQQRDGLFNDGGNLILGGNAPILQIKNVQPGTVVGVANSARDALHTGIIPDSTVEKIVAVLTVKNWIPTLGATEPGQLTGLMFGDGTQSNFLRVMFGSVNGVEGIEVGYELGDANYTLLAQVPIPELANALITEVDLRLVIDIENAYAVSVSYRLTGDTNYTLVPLNSGLGFALPVGPLQNVLNGTHTVTDGDTTLPSGAAFGVLAEDAPGGTTMQAIDFLDLSIQGIGNELLAVTGPEVGQAGTAGVDTIIYTGTDTSLDPLAIDVEHFDGRENGANYDVVGNDLSNDIAVGPGVNFITTLAGNDRIEGALASLAGDTITDFSINDAVVIADASTLGSTISYAAGATGGAVLTINGSSITFLGPLFEGFTAADGPARFDLQNTKQGLQITVTPEESVLYRVNAGGNTVAALDGGPDWQGDTGIIPGVTLSGSAGQTFSSGQVDEVNEVLAGNVDLSIVPWEVFTVERWDDVGGAELKYDFAVAAGSTYRVTLFYTENYDGVIGPDQRQFDVAVEGVIPAEFTDIDPLQDGAQHSTSGTLGVAMQREFTYTAQDDTLTLEFLHDIQNPKINAIEITQLGAPPPDTTGPIIASIVVDNPQGFSDGTRTATVILTDDRGFDVADFVSLDGSELLVTWSETVTVSAPVTTFSPNGKSATLEYTLTDSDNLWVAGTGNININQGAYTDAAGNPSSSGQAGFIIDPFLNQNSSVLYRVNAGGNTVAALDGGPDWQGDTGIIPGVTFSGSAGNTFGSGQVDEVNEVLAGNVDLAVVPWEVFAVERWDNAGGADLIYDFAVDAGTTYKITLFYTENYDGISGPDQRQFDVAVEGVVPAEFTDIDPLQDGAQYSTSGTLGVAMQREFTYTAQDDTLTLEFLHDIQSPKINAIEITQLGPLPPDTTGPTIASIIVDNPQGFSDGTRTATVILTDDRGFDAADFASLDGSELLITWSESITVSAPLTTISADGKTATLEYTLTDSDNLWVAGNGTIDIIPGAYTDAAGNPSPAGNASFIIDPFQEVVSIADAPTMVESGDAGFTTLTFALTANDPGVNGDVLIDISVNNAASVQTAVTFSNGVASYTVDVPNDTLVNGTEIITVSLVGIESGYQIAAGANTATGQVTEDDTDPTPLEILSGIPTNGSYQPGAIGSVFIAVTPTGTINTSTYNSNSFTIENTGDKKVAAVFVDLRTALYPDSVFDPDGQGGDTIAKDLTIDSGAALTGASVPLTHYFYGSGPDGSRGALVLFSDFDNSEIVGFSADVDPNSVAGTDKGPLDAGTLPSWDVGGISGAELMGSTITVLFDDGTTATSQLLTDGGQSGSQALATQADQPTNDIEITVNGVLEGGLGSYGGTVPEVLISGIEGTVVRVVMTKGFLQPVSGIYADLVAGRLAGDDFPVNNAVEFQFVDVTIPAGGVIDVSDQFTYNNNPNGFDFPGDNGLPLGFVAAAIDPNNNSVAVGSLTQPIYLAFNGTPVDEGGSNTPPVITSNGGGATAAINILENQEVVTTVTVNDPDVPGQSLSYGLSGADSALFQISGTGTLSFLAAPDFESPADQGGNNVYDVTVTVSDNAGGLDTQAISVAVGDVNEGGNNLFTLQLIDASTDAVLDAELVNNETITLSSAAFDGDLTFGAFFAPGQSAPAPVTITLSGNGLFFTKTEGLAPFALFGDSGGNYFGQTNGAPIGPGTYTLTATASNGQSQTTTFTLAVPSGGNTPPVITSNGGGTTAAITIQENSAAVTTVIVNDPDVPGQTLGYSLSGPDAALFQITGSGTLSFLAAPDFESPADQGGNNTYDVTVTVADGAGGSDSQALAVSVANINETGANPLTFQLIDADTDTILDTDMSNGFAALNPALFDGRITIAAVVAPGSSVSGPVNISLDRLDTPGIEYQKLEGFAPYALFGDSGGDYFRQTTGPEIEQGAYRLTASGNGFTQVLDFVL